MSTARRLTGADKRQIEAAIAKAKRQDKRQLSAQDSIPFQRMYPDGICRVTDNYFTKTISANSTFTVSNVPSSRAFAFTLELTHTSGTVTWFSGVQWPGGVAPSLTTGKTHIFVFLTDDGGTRWRGVANVNYTN